MAPPLRRRCKPAGLSLPPRLRPAGRLRRPARTGAFTILGGLLAVVILTASLCGLAIVTTRTREMASSKDSDVLDRIENAVTADLGWLKTYGQYWRMTKGPYNLSCTQAGLGADCALYVTSLTSTEYDPDETRCGTATGLAQDFVTAANSVTGLTPPRPFTVAVGSTTLIDSTNDPGSPKLPSGTSLVRTITLGKNLLFLSYRFTGSNATSYRFLREVALRPEVASWCP